MNQNNAKLLTYSFINKNANFFADVGYSSTNWTSKNLRMTVNLCNFFLAIGVVGGHSNQNNKHTIQGQANCQHKSSSRLLFSYWCCQKPHTHTHTKNNSDIKPIIRLNFCSFKGAIIHFVCIHCIRYRVHA